MFAAIPVAMTSLAEPGQHLHVLTIVAADLDRAVVQRAVRVDSGDPHAVASISRAVCGTTRAGRIAGP